MSTNTAPSYPECELLSVILLRDADFDAFDDKTFDQLHPESLERISDDVLAITGPQFEMLRLETIPLKTKMAMDQLLEAGLDLLFERKPLSMKVTITHFHIPEQALRNAAILRAARKYKHLGYSGRDAKHGISISFDISLDLPLLSKLESVDEHYAVLLREARLETLGVLDSLMHPFREAKLPDCGISVRFIKKTKDSK